MPMKKLLGVFAAVVLFCLLAVGASASDRITLVLDPGHGGSDPGATVGTRYESDYNYDVAVLLKGILEDTGKFDVYMTRGRDEYKNYLHRSLVAEEVGADMLISLHFNSNSALDPTLNGVEVLASVLDEWSPDTLAQGICASISAKCGLNNGGTVKKPDTGDERGVYYWNEEIGWDVPGTGVGRVSDYYSMISWGAKLGFPAIIVEHAYLSNASDLAFCDSADGLKKLAQAEADAIIAYFTGHTHTYAESRDRQANCCLGGVYSQKCTLCGHRQNVRYTDADPYAHAWTVESRTVTCTVDGYVNRECQISRNLGEKGLDQIELHTQSEVVPAPGHSLVTLVNTPASHGVDGVLRESCTACGEVFEEITPGDPHIYEKIESVAVTCEADGYDRYECTVCQDTYTDEFAATGHSYESDGEVLNCGSDGTKEYVCSVCGDVRNEGVQVPPHTFSLTAEKLPSCEDDGERITSCSVCGYEEVEVIPKTGHAYAQTGTVLLEATYFTEGKTVSVCANDESHEKVEVIPKKPGGIFIISAASAGAVALVAAIALLFVKAGKRRLREVADEVAAELEPKTETKAEKSAPAAEPEDVQLGLDSDK